MALHRVAGGMLICGNEVLLGKRTSSRIIDPDVWDVFGGHIESGEEPADALIRELQEELGITATGFSLIELIDDRDHPSGHDFDLYLYVVDEWEGTPENLQPEEHSMIEWFSFEKAQSLDLALPDEYRRIFRRIDQTR